MSSIQIFIWFLLYLMQLWALSIVVALPGLIAWLLRSNDNWKKSLGRELMPVLVRYQIILTVLAALIFFAGSYLRYFGEFRDAYVATAATIQTQIINVGLIWMMLAVFGVLRMSGKIREGEEKAVGLLWVVFALNVQFLYFFVTTSSTLFTSAPGLPVELSVFDIIVRSLHVLVSAIALVGTAVAFVLPVIAKQSAEHAEKAAKFALRWMLTGSSIQIITGTVLFVVVGMKAFPVPAGHILLTLGILSAIGVVVMSATSFSKTGSLLKIARATAMTTLLTFIMMVAIRMAHLTKLYETGTQTITQLIGKI